MSTFPTDAEREETERAIRSWTLDDAECRETQVDTIVHALAPLVAAREAAAEKRGRADAWDDGFDAGHQAARAVNPEWPALPTNPHRAGRGDALRRADTEEGRDD